MGPLVGVTTRTVLLPRDRVFDRCQAIGEFYLAAVRAAGAIPVAIPSSLDPAAATAALARLDGLLLSGGCDVDPAAWGGEPHPALGAVDPIRDAAELALARAAIEADRPVLGICRGLQVLNVARGGDLIQDLPSARRPDAVQHQVDSFAEGPGHSVAVRPGTRLFSILGTERLRVNSTHHQAAGRAGDGVVVSARAPDGVVEALELPDLRFVLGVQWHPERTAAFDEHSQLLFAAFAAACRGETHS